jgi:predicted ATPase with chaperone activity
MSLWANSPLQVAYAAFLGRSPAQWRPSKPAGALSSPLTMRQRGLIGGSDCLVADHLQEVCAFLEGHTSLSPSPEANIRMNARRSA